MYKTILITLISLISIKSVYAEFYSCLFTEPFFQVLVSTKNKSVTVISAYTPDSYQTKIVSMQEDQFSRKLKLANGKEMEVFRDKTGSDGMSDFIFPFDVKFDSFYGGCESEDEINETIISRLKSERASYGEALVNYWPGEYGYVMGHESLKKVTFSKKQTWNSLERHVRSDKECTIPAGKKFVHQLARKNEIYAHLSPIEKAKSGELEYVLAYSGEGYCLTETKAGHDFRECPEAEVKVSNPGEHRDLPDFGNYVFTKCEQGHYTWIGDNLLNNEENFKVINLGF